MKSSALLGSFNLNSSFLKTLEVFCLTPAGKLSKKCSSKLPVQGLMRNGQLFQQQIWEPATGERESGLLPTPRANSAMTVNLQTQRNRPELQPNLETVMAQMLPTPTTRDHKDSGPNVNYSKIAEKSHLPGVVVIACQATGEATYLNPSFVEEMMGYPVGWTDLRHSETASSHTWPQSHCAEYSSSTNQHLAA